MSKIQLILLCLMTFSVSSFAQLERGGMPGGEHAEGEGHEHEHEHAHGETHSGISIWHYYQDNLDTISFPVDTMLRRFHIYNEMFQQSASNTFLGNYGSPYISNIYQDRTSDDFIFADVYRAYSKRPEDLPIINTYTPFTLLGYGTGGPKKYAEENVSVMFS